MADTRPAKKIPYPHCDGRRIAESEAEIARLRQLYPDQDNPSS